MKSTKEMVVQLMEIHGSAAEVYDRVMALTGPKRDEAQIYYVIGESLYEKGCYKTSIFYLSKALELRPERQLYRLLLGMAYELTGEKEKAVETYACIAETKYESRFIVDRLVALGSN